MTRNLRIEYHTDLSGSLQGAGGVGGLIAIKSGSSAWFAAYDGNGNVIGLVDGTNGQTVAVYEYDPFGRTVRATGSASSANPIRFSTKYADAESDFLYYGYRYYNPSTGRWLNRDPIGESGGKNIYAFVVDPFRNGTHWGLEDTGEIQTLDPITESVLIAYVDVA